MKRNRSIQLGLLLLIALVASGVIAAFAFGHSTAGPPTNPGPPVTATGQLVVNGMTLDVTAFSTEASNPSTGGVGTGGGVGKANFQDLSVSAALDASNPALNLALAKGQLFPTAVLTYSWGAAGSTPATYTIELDDALITSISEGADGGAPTENLTLAFGKVHWTFTDMSGTTTSGWDLGTNTALP